MDGSLVRRRMPRGLGALGCSSILVAVAFLLAQAPGAMASSATWSGESNEAFEWSFPANWEGAAAPKALEALSTLTFPRLTSTACTSEIGRKNHACYLSINDIEGLTAETVDLDDGNEYLLGGEMLTIGKGGMDVAPPSGSESTGDLLEMPIHLGAQQKWRIADRIGGAVGENGVLLTGNVTGHKPLTIEQTNGAVLYLLNDTEVGALSIEGPGTGIHPLQENGAVLLIGGELNAMDEEPVELRHMYFAGFGAVGALSTAGSLLLLGSEAVPAGALHAASVTLDSGSVVLFEATTSGALPGEDYAQLTSAGPVELDDAQAALLVRPPEGEEGPGVCPTVSRGETFTLVSTSGPLSGEFRNAPEGGPEVPIEYSGGCTGPATMRVTYNRSGAEKTVTGEVEAAAREQEEARKAEEARRAQEEKAAREAREREEGQHSVLASKEASPDATIAGTSVRVSASGVLVLTVDCPAGVSTCAGTVTLRTLHAVAASAHANARVVTIASGSFSVPGAHKGTVKLHLSSKLRALIARLHSLKVNVTITARDPQGASHTGHALLTVRAPKPRRRH